MQAAPKLMDVPQFKYDLVDVERQVLTDTLTEIYREANQRRRTEPKQMAKVHKQLEQTNENKQSSKS